MSISGRATTRLAGESYGAQVGRSTPGIRRLRWSMAFRTTEDSPEPSVVHGGAPQAGPNGEQRATLQVCETSTPPLSPDAKTPTPEIEPEQVRPICLLFWMVTKSRFAGPLAGSEFTRIPPQGVAPCCPGPLLVMVVLSISNAAPSRRIPPPLQLSTVTVSKRSVPPFALIPVEADEEKVVCRM
jgi:hypothetical protein